MATPDPNRWAQLNDRDSVAGSAPYVHIFLEPPVGASDRLVTPDPKRWVQLELGGSVAGSAPYVTFFWDPLWELVTDW